MSTSKGPFLPRKWRQIKKRFYAHVNREKLVRLRYKEKFGVEPDLQHPALFDEKILWLMLHADTSRWTRLADKYRVREYVRECGLGWTLNELYGVWESADGIDFDALPDEFVLKTNNGYGDVVVVHDKRTIDRKAVVRRLNHDLRRRFGRMSGEHHYLGIQPCILAEKLLPNDPGLGSSIVDYKFFCFDGEPAYCQVCTNRLSGHDRQIALFEPHTWENCTDRIDSESVGAGVPRPASLAQMLDIARQLSSGFPLLRVDLYEVAGKPVFGELTFTPGAGLNTEYGLDLRLEMGRLITLPPPSGRVQNARPAATGIFAGGRLAAFVYAKLRR